MNKNEIEKKNLEKVSGGTRWEQSEDEWLRNNAENYYTNQFKGIDWKTVAKELNSYFHNGRTASACATRFGKLKSGFVVEN